MRSFCHSSEGQAFLKFKELEHSLSFQSKFSNSPNKWDLVFEIPFKGEENLVLTSKTKELGGSIFEKIESQYQKLKQINSQIYLDAMQELQALKQSLSLFLDFTLQTDFKNCMSVEMTPGVVKGHCDEFTTWSYKENKDFTVIIKKPFASAQRHLSAPRLVADFKKFEAEKYAEMQLSYYPNGDRLDEMPMLQIDLNNESCQK